MKRDYRVTVGTRSVLIRKVNNPGTAARRAFKILIKEGHLKRQPKSNPDGTWENTSIELFS